MSQRQGWANSTFAELIGIGFIILASAAGCRMCSSAITERERAEREAKEPPIVRPERETGR
jgi:hypothetical protein